ncbi:MAG: hypothetical protein AMXMBFR84_44320 [Candidatus Hydrogenedentota bacterium]
MSAEHTGRSAGVGTLEWALELIRDTAKDESHYCLDSYQAGPVSMDHPVIRMGMRDRGVSDASLDTLRF